MTNFKKAAEKLGLNDLGKDFPGDKVCKDCGTSLRLGKNEKGHEQSYCPKCIKIVATVFIPRLQLPIKITPHND